MTPFKSFLLIMVLLFGTIGVVAGYKKYQNKRSAQIVQEASHSFPSEEGLIEIELEKKEEVSEEPAPLPQKEVPQADRIHLLFKENSPLDIVETIQYKSRAPWKGGRTAWLCDYASHYQTPIDFILKSMPKVDPKNIRDGQRFSVFRKGKDFSFYLVVDASRTKLWLYLIQPEKKSHLLLKSYDVGLGKRDEEKESGLLTPLGAYTLGKRCAVFKPRMMGMHKKKKVELMTVFGTRWIPFESECGTCTEPAKGFGIHGFPYIREGSRLVEDTSSISDYQSDGCIRLRAEDVEELYAVIAARKATVEIVKDFYEASIPYTEQSIE